MTRWDSIFWLVLGMLLGALITAICLRVYLKQSPDAPDGAGSEETHA